MSPPEPATEDPRNPIIEWAFRSLRSTRYQILADSEAVVPALQTLEAITGFDYMTGQPLEGTFADRLGALGNFLNNHLSDREHTDYCRLAHAVRANRNTHVHEGAKARNTVRLLLDFILLLEHAFCSIMPNTVQTYMVTEIISVAPWQPLKHARRRMLENSFTWLPIRFDDGWLFIADFAIHHHLREMNRTQREKHLNMPLIDLREALDTRPALWTTPHVPISELDFPAGATPYLVRPDDTSPMDQLCGILTAFDLL